VAAPIHDEVAEALKLLLRAWAEGRALFIAEDRAGKRRWLNEAQQKHVEAERLRAEAERLRAKLRDG
jgi:hypothetical protein